MAKILTDEVYLLRDLLSITFLDTKTSAKVGPFTLSMKVESAVAVVLQRWVELARKENRRFVFLKGVEPESEIAKLERAVHEELPWRLDLRALRRTGLSLLAQSGCTTETLLSISRHASVKMLEVYLHRGIFNVTMGCSQADAFLAAWNHVLQVPRRIQKPCEDPVE